MRFFLLDGGVAYTLPAMDPTTAAIAFFASLAAALAGTRLALSVLARRHVLDHPNERSSHTRPTPSGGGIAVIAVIIVSWTMIGWGASEPPAGLWPLLAVGVFLAAVSFIDDLRSLPPVPRLAAQAAAVAFILIQSPLQGPVFAGLLPPPADTIVAGILWVWFINLFNFMDGIDGIAGVETAAIGIGIALVAVLIGDDGSAALVGLTAAGAAAGFLCWNWQPAKIFMGDVGSVPIGFLLGWLLLGLASQGQWAAALILPLYFLGDATITLIRRGLRGEKVWTPHRQHYYQQAVKRGESHASVTGAVAQANVFLIALAALAASGQVVAALAGAALVVVVLLARLGGWDMKKTDAGEGE